MILVALVEGRLDRITAQDIQLDLDALWLGCAAEQSPEPFDQFRSSCGAERAGVMNGAASHVNSPSERSDGLLKSTNLIGSRGWLLDAHQSSASASVSINSACFRR